MTLPESSAIAIAPAEHADYEILALIGNSCRSVRHVAGALITAMCRTACVHTTVPLGCWVQRTATA